MAAYDLQEQEQISAIKDWWAKNGGRVTYVLVVCALCLLGWTVWQRHQATQSGEIGMLYMAVAGAAEANDLPKLRILSKEIIEKHASSVSAQLSALLLAKAELARGDVAAAQTQFEWAATKGHDPLIRDLARLRLATLQVDAQKYDDSLKTLEAAPATAFVPRFEDLRGDILSAKGDAATARDAYKKALSALGESAGQDAATFRMLVQTKLDALGGA